AVADAGHGARRARRQDYFPRRGRGGGIQPGAELRARLADVARQGARGAMTLHTLTAVQLLEGYRTKAFSPVEVAKAVVARIEQLNPKLNAFNLISKEIVQHAQ